MIEIKEINNKKIWEDFLAECNEKTFLDSWNWGEFNKKMGNKIWRLGIFNGGEQIAATSVIKIQAKRGTFLFVPHGPNIKSQNLNLKTQILEVALKELKKIAKEERAIFIRIAPIWPARYSPEATRPLRLAKQGGREPMAGGEKNEENIKIFKEFGFRESPIHIHPELTWELDLTPSEDELLMGMRKTTRYLIRQAQKNKDIEIIKSNKIEDVETFNKLYQETVDRHHFTPFSLGYLKNEFLAFSPDGQILFFLGKYKGEVVSSAMIIYWQGMGFYHQGASSLKYSKIPVSYLLQWEAIREAKNRGFKTYNFWGIAPISSFDIQSSEFKRHPWYGLTLFKMGFGGYKKEYVKTQDLPLSKKYWICYLIEKLRSKKRGF